MSQTHPLTTTAFDLPGYRVTKSFGVVRGIIVRSRSIVGNIGASMRTVFGGEAKGYTKLLADSREEAIARMRHEANLRGANAVIAFRFDGGEIADMMSEVAAYGTAVKIRPRTP